MRLGEWLKRERERGSVFLFVGPLARGSVEGWERARRLCVDDYFHDFCLQHLDKVCIPPPPPQPSSHRFALPTIAHASTLYQLTSSPFHKSM